MQSVVVDGDTYKSGLDRQTCLRHSMKERTSGSIGGLVDTDEAMAELEHVVSKTRCVNRFSPSVRP